MKLNHVPFLTLRQALPALMILTLLPGCANRKGSGSGTLSDYGDGGYADAYGDIYDPYGNGSGYAEDIALQGRPDGVNFYSSNVNRNLYPAIYFGFDEYDVPNSEFGKVQQAAEYLRTTQAQLIIAGHTDAVGTSEYNRNLGELSGLAVRSALVQMGIDAGRVQTVSFGEDYPADSSAGESQNATNRRAEFGFYR